MISTQYQRSKPRSTLYTSSPSNERRIANVATCSGYGKLQVVPTSTQGFDCGWNLSIERGFSVVHFLSMDLYTVDIVAIR